MEHEASSGEQRTLNFVIKDRHALYTAFMPFIKNGGLFIPTTKRYRIGDELLLLLRLMDESGTHPHRRQGRLADPCGRRGEPGGRRWHPVQRSGPGCHPPQD